MKTAVDWFAQELYERFEMKGDGEVFNDLLKQAKQIEKEQIIIAEMETLRVIEKYGISSIEPLINELKQELETFKSE